MISFFYKYCILVCTPHYLNFYNILQNIQVTLKAIYFLFILYIIRCFISFYFIIFISFLLFFLYDFEDHRFFFFLNVFNLFSSAKNLAIRFINVFSAAGLQSHALAKYLKISGNVVRIFYIVIAFSTYFI